MVHAVPKLQVFIQTQNTSGSLPGSCACRSSCLPVVCYLPSKVPLNDRHQIGMIVVDIAFKFDRPPLGSPFSDSIITVYVQSKCLRPFSAMVRFDV